MKKENDPKGHELAYWLWFFEVAAPWFPGSFGKPLVLRPTMILGGEQSAWMVNFPLGQNMWPWLETTEWGLAGV